RVLGRLLEAAVERGADEGACHRLLALEDADRPPVGVDLDLLRAVAPAKDVVVQALEPGLPDEVAAPESTPAALEVALRRLPHVPQEVGGKVGARIGPLRLHLHRHAGEVELPLLDAGDVVQAQTAGEADGPG